MNFETLIKYLEFLKSQCLRHSNDGFVDENELQLFTLELNKFKLTLEKSNLNYTIKEKVNVINFDLSEPKFKGINLIAYFIGNGWSNDKKREEIMAQKLKRISEEIEYAIIEIKMII